MTMLVPAWLCVVSLCFGVAVGLLLANTIEWWRVVRKQQRAERSRVMAIAAREALAPIHYTPLPDGGTHEAYNAVAIAERFSPAWDPTTLPALGAARFAKEHGLSHRDDVPFCEAELPRGYGLIQCGAKPGHTLSTAALLRFAYAAAAARIACGNERYEAVLTPYVRHSGTPRAKAYLVMIETGCLGGAYDAGLR